MTFEEEHAIATILLIRFDGIGDAAILAPLIVGLRTAGHRLDIVLSERNYDVFTPDTFSARFPVPWNAWKTRHVERTFAALIPQLRARRYDWALIATEELAAYRLARACRIPKRRGFANGWEKPLKTIFLRSLCTNTIYRPASLREPVHEARVQYRLAQGLGVPPQPSRDQNLLRPLFIEEVPEREDAVALQVSSKWERLGLDVPALSLLVRRIKTRHSIRLLAACSDAELARKIADAHDTPLDIFDELAPWKQAIARARLLITPDTGAAHIAGMIGTRTIDCFPAEDFALQSARWAPWAAPTQCVVLSLDGESAITRIMAALASA